VLTTKVGGNVTDLILQIKTFQRLAALEFGGADSI
jgi:hypothetical protein